MNPLISVIVPTYNRKDFLVVCLDAIMNQTYSPIETIVIDDGSTDGTGALLAERYGQRIHYCWQDHSGLPAVARNRGLQLARGELIAFCDSDDVWYPNKLELQVSRMHDRQANCSCSDAAVIGDSENRYLDHYRFRYTDLRKELLCENFFICSSVVLERSVLGQTEFTTVAEYRGYEDYVLWLSLRSRLRIDYVDKPLLWYRKHYGNVSRQGSQRDALIRLRILCSESAYLLHPLLWVRNLLKIIRRLFG